MKTIFKNMLKVIVSVFSIILVFGLGYIMFMQSSYYRIEDMTDVSTKNQVNQTVKTGQPLKAVTYNIGFGAYDRDFSFFMDNGFMKDGTEVVGKQSKASSKEAVKTNTKGSVNIIKDLDTDFVLLQEVDKKATRSHNINQVNNFVSKLSSYAHTFSLNFHSPYLLYPLTSPHGSVQSGLLTFSKYNIQSATRRSYPVDKSFFTKFFDLDRAFVVHRLQTDNKKELVLVNSHMSAYDDGGKIRKEQFKMLNTFMEQEYKKGNYIIVGGDFNHVLGGNMEQFSSQQQVPSWVHAMNNEMIANGMNIVLADNQDVVATCRTCDLPYQEGVNYLANVDGFIVSDNITASAENIDNNFMYSDHQPVVLSFTLN